MFSPFKEGYSDFFTEDDNKENDCIFMNGFTSIFNDTDDEDDKTKTDSSIKDFFKEYPLPPLINKKYTKRKHYISDKVGIYTIEERKKRLSRWRKKRLQNRENRKNKKIKYLVRQKFANSRPRIGGRFIKMKK